MAALSHLSRRPVHAQFEIYSISHAQSSLLNPKSPAVNPHLEIKTNITSEYTFLSSFTLEWQHERFCLLLRQNFRECRHSSQRRSQDQAMGTRWAPGL